MDKESIIMTFITTAVLGLAVYAVIHELQPVLVMSVQYFGVVMIIVTMAVCFGGLFFLIIVVMDKPYQESPRAGTVIAMELLKQRRIKLTQESVKPYTPEPLEVPDIIREGSYLL